MSVGEQNRLVMKRADQAVRPAKRAVRRNSRQRAYLFRDAGSIRFADDIAGQIDFPQDLLIGHRAPSGVLPVGDQIDVTPGKWAGKRDRLSERILVIPNGVSG